MEMTNGVGMVMKANERRCRPLSSLFVLLSLHRRFARTGMCVPSRLLRHQTTAHGSSYICIPLLMDALESSGWLYAAQDCQVLFSSGNLAAEFSSSNRAYDITRMAYPFQAPCLNRSTATPKWCAPQSNARDALAGWQQVHTLDLLRMADRSKRT